MTKTDERYFRWLVRQVAIENRREYYEVLWQMFNTEFVSMPNVMHDENRMMDGLELRSDFIRDKGLRGGITAAPCSILEVMIALSQRLSFQVGGRAQAWAWQLLLNLGFERFHDPLSAQKIDQVGEALNALVYRTYSPSGDGGFFPLQNPDEDQTRIEIWYQMAAYIGEVLPD